MTLISNSFFSVSSKLFQIALSLVSLAFLGRLLSPVDFGVFGVFTAVRGIVLPLLEVGLKPIYVRLKEKDPQLGNIFYTLYFLTSFGAVLILVISGFFISYIKGDSIYFKIIGLGSLPLLLSSFYRQRVAELAALGEFKQLAIARAIIQVFVLGATLLSAVAGFGIWSLIISLYVEAIGLYFVFLFIARHQYTFESFSKIFESIHIVISGIRVLSNGLLTGALMSIDKLFFSYFFGDQLHGYYNRAFAIAQIPDSYLRNPLLLPFLNHLKRLNLEQKKVTYIKAFKFVIYFLALPCYIFILSGDQILPLLLGEQWIQAGVFFQIAGLWGVGKLLHGLFTIMSLSESHEADLVRKCIFALPMILLPTVVFGVIYKNPYIYCSIYSSLYFFYWIYHLLNYLRNYNPDSNNVYKILLGVPIILLLLFCLKYMAVFLGDEAISLSGNFLLSFLMALVVISLGIFEFRNYIKIFFKNKT